MKAEIFFSETQEASVEQIKRLLQQKIYSAIEITTHVIKIEPFLREDPYKHHALRYVKLLQASIPPARGLEVAVTDIAYGFYIYSSYFGQRRGFAGDRCRSLAPAVAIQDRMVLVPLNLGKELAGTDDVLFRPLEIGGVREIDFESAEALEEAVTQVGQLLRSDVLHDVRAYGTYHELNAAELEKLAGDWGMDLGFIKESLKSRATESVFYSKLSCSVDRERVPLRRWSKLVVSIRNDSDVSLSRLSVQVSGPVKVLPVRIQTNVAAHSNQDLPIAIMPEDLGDFPLEITLILAEDEMLLDWVPTHHVWLHVDEAAAAAPAS